MIHQESRHTYGNPSIWYTLIRRGQQVGEHRVARLLRQDGIRAKTVNKWRAHPAPASVPHHNHQHPGSWFTVSALASRVPMTGLPHHSDCGSHYSATSYQRLLQVHGLHPSMSRQGNCWDNACVESFFETLTRELVSHRHDATRDEIKQDIFEYIEVYSNRQRRHPTLGYGSPAEYEARSAVS